MSLLANAYVDFANRLSSGISRINPSGYIELQGAFAQRLATEMRKRLGLKCELELKTQTEYSEPKIRINTDVPDIQALQWNESEAWDDFAAYYAELLNPQSSIVNIRST